MTKLSFLFVLSTAFLFSCNKNRESKNAESELQLNNGNQNSPAIISGKILNLEVYPHVKEVKLTIPGFEGDETKFTIPIGDSGQFKFEFYPKTNREVKLYPIEDILVVQPGDSLYIVKDFKDISTSSFYGDRAALNKQISKFKGGYLGRYPSNYQLSYLDFKKECEIEKSKNYQRLIEFQENNFCTDEFNGWAIKLIELDYCTALFHYPYQHFLRSKIPLEDTTEYFSFIEGLENKVDNSIVMSNYFKTTQQYVYFQINKLRKGYDQQYAKKDTNISLMINDIFASTANDYLAQFSLRTFLNISLISHQTDWIDNYRDQINDKLNDPFLTNNLQEHYDRVQDLKNNPKRFSDAILGLNNNVELNKGTAQFNNEESNTVKDLISANPNKVIYVDFWAPWCPPCVHSKKYSKQLMTEFKDKDVEFAFICINSNEDLWRKSVDKLKIGGKHIYCDIATSRAIRQRFGFSGIPYFLLINKEGVIVDFGPHLNPRNMGYVKTQIEKLLNE